MAQIALTLTLLWATELWDKSVTRTDMPGAAPAFSILVSLNAPIALPRSLVFMHMSDFWDNVTLIVAIGLLWYWVALNIQSWSQRRTVVMFSWIPLRLAADLLLIIDGVFWFVLCIANIYFRLFFPFANFAFAEMPPIWFFFASAFQLAWSLVLIYFCGRDLFSLFSPQEIAGSQC
jgi:hypothetical protein